MYRRQAVLLVQGPPDRCVGMHHGGAVGVAAQQYVTARAPVNRSTGAGAPVGLTPLRTSVDKCVDR